VKIFPSRDTCFPLDVPFATATDPGPNRKPETSVIPASVIVQVSVSGRLHLDDGNTNFQRDFNATT